MELKKSYDISVSKKYPDGSIATIRLGTQKGIDLLDPNQEKAASAALFKEVYMSTMADLKSLVESDPLAKSVWKNTKQVLVDETKVDLAERKLKK